MNGQENRVREAALKIYKELNRVLKIGPWETSLLLMGIGKKLKELRSLFEEALALSKDEEKRGDATSQVADQQVYIALYQAQGDQLARWQYTLSNLSDQYMSRPVYQHEADARSAIALAGHPYNHAYVVVRIKPDAILISSPDRKSVV